VLHVVSWSVGCRQVFCAIRQQDGSRQNWLLASSHFVELQTPVGGCSLLPRTVLFCDPDCAAVHWLAALLHTSCSVRGCLNLPLRGDSPVGALQVSGLTDTPTAAQSSRSAAAIRIN